MRPHDGIDAAVRAGGERAICTHPAQARYSLRAVPPNRGIVKNANVSLRGAIPGVQSFTNGLAVNRAR